MASQAGSMASKASAAIFSERRMPVSLSNMPTATTGAKAPVSGAPARASGLMKRVVVEV